MVTYPAPPGTSPQTSRAACASAVPDSAPSTACPPSSRRSLDGKLHAADDVVAAQLVIVHDLEVDPLVRDADLDVDGVIPDDGSAAVAPRHLPDGRRLVGVVPARDDDETLHGVHRIRPPQVPALLYHDAQPEGLVELVEQARAEEGCATADAKIVPRRAHLHLGQRFVPHERPPVALQAPDEEHQEAGQGDDEQVQQDFRRRGARRRWCGSEGVTCCWHGCRSLD
eukprot:CAMPEP_0197897732 /NCGR_PEP_ID=MMETSP1439-20131203/42344_1 /TAXON_ID=66791 /ORGANISM="Gonyaulax spinifera, Strain CCMP409" /LENGTH=225 /DNA_ID=CAMNT_0043518381 /DNA_START=34 /DNA_END=713 /DNA_ORIENTATION=+